MADPTGEVDRTTDVHADWPRTEVHDLLPWLLAENRVLASSVLFRREALSLQSDCRYSGDWVALLRASRLGPFAQAPERATFWRQHGANSYRASTNQVVEEARVRRSIASATWPTSVAVREGLARNAIALSALELRLDDRSAARRHAAQAADWPGLRRTATMRYVASLLPYRQVVSRLWPGEPPWEASTRHLARTALGDSSLISL